MSSVANAISAQEDAARLKKLEVSCNDQASFHAWKTEVLALCHARRVTTGNNAPTVFDEALAPGIAILAAHNANPNPPPALPPPPAPAHQNATEYMLTLMRLTVSQVNRAKIQDAATGWEAWYRQIGRAHV